MPSRSHVFRLPRPLQQELIRRLVRSNFSDYQEHSEWLKGEGYSLSASTLHRFGQTVRTSLQGGYSTVGLDALIRSVNLSEV